MWSNKLLSLLEFTSTHCTYATPLYLYWRRLPTWYPHLVQSIKCDPFLETDLLSINSMNYCLLWTHWCSLFPMGVYVSNVPYIRCWAIYYCFSLMIPMLKTCFKQVMTGQHELWCIWTWTRYELCNRWFNFKTFSKSER